MPNPDFTLKLINNNNELCRLSDILISVPVFALDIETTEWWNKHREKVALIQIAYRTKEQLKVAIIDTLADLDLTPLRQSLEASSILKIVHNAGFDAVRLNKYYGFNLTPVFDTMAAARRNGERKYSLKAQSEIHLKLHLDKSAQGSDWSRRPLDVRQLHYAALDPFATLLLYENQQARNLNGSFRLLQPINATQNMLPLEVPELVEAVTVTIPRANEKTSLEIELSEVAIALLGIITELPTRYSPDALAVSVGSERVGLAGWIIDKRLGVNAEQDEETVKLAIADLCEKGLIRITETRRLEATETGVRLWHSSK